MSCRVKHSYELIPAKLIFCFLGAQCFRFLNHFCNIINLKIKMHLLLLPSFGFFHFLKQIPFAESRYSVSNSWSLSCGFPAFWELFLLKYQELPGFAKALFVCWSWNERCTCLQSCGALRPMDSRKNSGVTFALQPAWLAPCRTISFLLLNLPVSWSRGSSAGVSLEYTWCYPWITS